MEIHMKKIFTAIVVSALIGSGAVIAAEHETTTAAQPDYQADFNRLDVNKDGYLEKPEVTHEPLLAKQFSKIATNGRLGESKYAAWEAKHHHRHATEK
jgi:hypothetical protein